MSLVVKSDRFLTLMTILLVVMSYLLFLPSYFFYELAQTIPETNYQYLTAGFLSGQLNLSISPSPTLLNLPDPYDHLQNTSLRLTDASLYENKYYLYFGPLPVLSYFMPYKIFTGFYPSEASAVFLFVSIGFIINFLLITKIRKDYFPFITNGQLIFAGLLLGFANNSLFLLKRPMFWEVAIASAFCFGSLTIFFLYQLLHGYLKAKDIILFSFLAALVVAARPHFALACMLMIFFLSIFLYLEAPKHRFKKLILSLYLPAFTIAVILCAYNYLRFHSIFEFGQNYQLTGIPSPHQIKFLEPSLIPKNILPGIFYYLLQPFSIQATFPYFYLNPYIYTDSIYFLESIAGIFVTTPCILFIFFLPSQIEYYLKNKNYGMKSLAWFLAITLNIPIIILLFLTLPAGATQRYISDFSPYLLLLSIISVWLLEKYDTNSFRIKLFRLLFIMSGILSILTAIILASPWEYDLIFLQIGHVAINFHSLFIPIILIFLIIGYCFVILPLHARIKT